MSAFPFRRLISGAAGVGDIRVLVSMEGVDSVISGIQVIDRSLTGLGVRAGPLAPLNLAVSALGAAAAAAGTAMITAAGKAAAFETSMTAVGIVSDKSGAELAALGDDLQQLSIEVGQSSNSLADALRLILGSGIIETSEAFHVLEVAARGAVAGFTNTSTVAAALTATLKSYDLSVAETQRISDVYFKTVEQGVITIDQLATGIGEVLPFASQANVSVEQLGAALGTLTVQGVGAAESITALRSLFARVSEMAENARKAGLQFDALRATAGGLPTLLAEIESATKGDTAALDKLIPRIEAKLAVLKLIGPGEKELARQMEGVANAAGATDEAFQRVDQTVQAAWQTFKAKLNVEFQDLGENLLPAIKQGFDDLGESIPRMVESLGTLIPVFTAIVAGITSASKALSDFVVQIEIMRGFVRGDRATALTFLGPLGQVRALFELRQATGEAGVELERFRIEQQRTQQQGEALAQGLGQVGFAAQQVGEEFKNAATVVGSAGSAMAASLNQVGFSFHGVNVEGAEFTATAQRLPAILSGAGANLLAFDTAMGGLGTTTEDTAKKMADAALSINRSLRDMELEVAGELGQAAMERIKRETEDLVLEIKAAQKEFGKKNYPDSLIGQAYELGQQKLDIFRNSLKLANLSAEELEQRLARSNQIIMGGLVLGTPVAPTADLNLPLINRGMRELNEAQVDYEGGQARITAENAKQGDQLRDMADTARHLAQTFDSEVAQAFSNVLSIGLDFLGNIQDGVVSAEDLRGALVGVGQILGELGGLAGALGRGLAGAAAGSKFGVPGAIVGGVVGLVSGLFGDKGEAERHANAMEKLTQATERLSDTFENAPIEVARAQSEAFRKAVEVIEKPGTIHDFEKGTVGITGELKELLLAAGLTEEEIRALRAAMNDAREEGIDPIRFAVEFLEQAAGPAADAVKAFDDSIRDFLESNKFELADIEDIGTRVAMQWESVKGGLTDAFTPDLETLAGLEAFEAFITDQITRAAELGLTPEQVENLKALVLEVDALGDEARESAEKINQFTQSVADSDLVADLFGETALESFDRFAGHLTENFPLLGEALFAGLDLATAAGVEQVIARLQSLFEVWDTLTAQQQADIAALYGMTAEQFEEAAGTVLARVRAVQEDADREREARERALRDRGRDRARPRRAIADRAEKIGRPTVTQTTIEAEPMLRDIMGTNRTIAETLNAHMPGMHEKLGLIAIARPGDVNRALGESFIFDTLTAR